jgi:hypothetical protein
LRRDGGLRQLFRSRFPTWQWSAIETWTAAGVPDSEYCTPGGAAGWIECKATSAWKVEFEPLQPAWIHRRARYGGRVWVAVRRLPTAKKFAGTDELWLIPGIEVLKLALGGLKAMDAAQAFEGGPANWNWARIRTLLTLELQTHVAPGPDVSHAGVPHPRPAA